MKKITAVNIRHEDERWAICVLFMIPAFALYAGHFFNCGDRIPTGFVLYDIPSVWFLITLKVIMTWHLLYYMVWLPGWPEHASVMRKWRLPLLLQGGPMFLAYSEATGVFED